MTDIDKQLNEIDERNDLTDELVDSVLLEKAHTHCLNNEEEIKKSEVCGCFHCLKFFAPKEINFWLMKNGRTACCPSCHIDTVIGDASGIPLTAEFLKQMQTRWFKYIEHEKKGTE